MKTQFGKFTLAGDGLCIGPRQRRRGERGLQDPGEFKNGRIMGVGVTVEKEQYLDLEKLAAAAMAVD